MSKKIQKTELLGSKLEAAINYSDDGLPVIPVSSVNKRPRVPWGSLPYGLPRPAIEVHWSHHPDDDIAMIVGDDIVVFDADSPEAVARLYQIEDDCDCHPNLISKTRRGEHHIFALPGNLNIRSCSFCTDKNPERIDIKTGKNLVILPPSSGKFWIVTEGLCHE